MARKGSVSGSLKANWTVTTQEDCAVYLVGSARELGEWSPDRALPMHGQHVGGHVHDWNIDLALPRGERVEFKFIKKSDTGEVFWENGENHVFAAVGPDSIVHWGSFR